MPVIHKFCDAPGGLVPPERKLVGYGALTSKLLHLPDKPAGVG